MEQGTGNVRKMNSNVKIMVAHVYLYPRPVTSSLTVLMDLMRKIVVSNEYVGGSGGGGGGVDVCDCVSWLWNDYDDDDQDYIHDNVDDDIIIMMIIKKISKAN